MYQRITKSVPVDVSYILSQDNILANISSQSFKALAHPAWSLFPMATDTHFLTSFNSTSPLTQDASWVLATPSLGLTFSVISMLYNQQLLKQAWTTLPEHAPG